ncbi:peroxidase 60-like protein, partial [Tanacetum coccineum]
ERVCPGVVSCADIIVMATRDAVSCSGGGRYVVRTGRRDGSASIAQNAAIVPSPFIVLRSGVLQIDQELALDSLTKSTVKAIARSIQVWTIVLAKLDILLAVLPVDVFVTRFTNSTPTKVHSTPPVILLSDKLITVNNFTTLVLVKLDIDEINYSSWVYFFKILCEGFEVLKLVLGEPTNEATLSFSHFVGRLCSEFKCENGLAYMTRVNGNNSLWSTSNVRPTSSSTTTHNMTQEQVMALIYTQQALMAQFMYHGNQGVGQSCIGTQEVHSRNGNNVTPGLPGQPTSVGSSGQPAGHETLLPNAFSALTLQDHTPDAWNMDTGFLTRRVLLRCDSTGGSLPGHKALYHPSSLSYQSACVAPATWTSRK